MRAGDLRQRIIIEENKPTRDEFNAAVASWATFATLWAMVEATAGTEQIDQQHAQTIANYTITLRYYAGITTAMRVHWGDLYLDIHAVLDDPASGEMKLICSEALSGQ